MEKKIYAKDGKAIIEIGGGIKISLTTKELQEAFDAIRNERGGGDFITLYTDASYNPNTKAATVAYKGRCHEGPIQGSITLANVGDSNLAEMLAIELAVKESIEKYPAVIGFSIRSDNMTCVHAFWDFDRRRFGVAKIVEPPYLRIQQMLDGRWTRVKHVKAHTNGKDMASVMNRAVDKKTRVKGSEMVAQ